MKKYLLLKRKYTIFLFMIVFAFITIGRVRVNTKLSSKHVQTNSNRTAILSSVKIRNLSSLSQSVYDDFIFKNKLNNFSIITATNYGFREFALNWILNLKKLDINKFVVFCFDSKVFYYLKSKGYEQHLLIVPDEWLDSKLESDFANFNTKDYNKIVRAKSHIWFQMIKQNHFIFSDPDVV